MTAVRNKNITCAAGSVTNWPCTPGLVYFRDAREKILFIAAGPDLRSEGLAVLEDERIRDREIQRPASIDFEEVDLKALPEKFGRSLRIHEPALNLSLPPDTLEYPHLILTAYESFPRLLATRRLNHPDAEVFGPFLPVFRVRDLLARLPKIFKLRSCVMEIDGKAAQSCMEHSLKRCLGPCVEALCGREEYLDAVADLRLFLGGEQELLQKRFEQKIAAASDSLDFERAAKLRDQLQSIIDLGGENGLDLSLDDAVDTIRIEITETAIQAHLLTQRSRRVIGRRSFLWEDGHPFYRKDSGRALEQILPQLYPTGLPREIRVESGFRSRAWLSKAFAQRAGRSYGIKIIAREEVGKRLDLSLKNLELRRETEQLVSYASPARRNELLEDLRSIFALPAPPHQIEALDISHLAGAHTTAGLAVWRSDEMQPQDYRFFLLDGFGEVEAIAEALRLRFSQKGVEQRSPTPDFILIDGGKAQLQSAVRILQSMGLGAIGLAAAVKPPRQAQAISHFLTPAGEKITPPKDSPGFRLLLRLRDEAHRYSNQLQRSRHSVNMIFDAEIPIVPTRQDDPRGSAQDLIPL